jgi:hypothetical protein
MRVHRVVVVLPAPPASPWLRRTAAASAAPSMPSTSHTRWTGTATWSSSSDSDRRQRYGRARDERDPAPAGLMPGRRVGRLGLPAGTAGLLFIVGRGRRAGFAMRHA